MYFFPSQPMTLPCLHCMYTIHNHHTYSKDRHITLHYVYFSPFFHQTLVQATTSPLDLCSGLLSKLSDSLLTPGRCSNSCKRKLSKPWVRSHHCHSLPSNFSIFSPGIDPLSIQNLIFYPCFPVIQSHKASPMSWGCHPISELHASNPSPWDSLFSKPQQLCSLNFQVTTTLIHNVYCITKQ